MRFISPYLNEQIWFKISQCRRRQVLAARLGSFRSNFPLKDPDSPGTEGSLDSQVGNRLQPSSNP